MGHTVCGDLIGAEQRYNAAQSNLHQLEDAVFQSVGNGDVQNAFHQAAIVPENPFAAVYNRILLSEAQPGNHHSGEGAGNQGGVGNTCHPCPQDEYADHISNHIDDIGRYGQVHGDAGLANAAKQCGTGIVDGQGRIGIGGNAQIKDAGIHHILFNLPKQRSQHSLISQEHKHPDEQGKCRREGQKLAGSFSGILRCPPPDVLADDNRAAGSQCGEQIDENGVELIHQRDPGYRRFSGVADDQGVCQPHQHHQQLL